MRFTFDAPNVQDGIRVIRGIPDYPLCYLEGQNGTGKTLALHLLELATGHQPYGRMPAAWRSLKGSLGRVTIGISIKGLEPITIELNPETWPELPDPVDERFGVAHRDGGPLKLSELAGEIRVVRVAGDETFDRTIRSRIEAYAAVVERVRGRFETRLMAVETRLRALDLMLGPILPERLGQERSRVGSLRAELADLQAQMTEAAALRQLLERAIAASNRVRAVKEDLPALLNRKAQLENTRSNLERRQRDLELKRQDLQPSLSRQAELSRLLEAAEGLTNRRATRLRNIEVELARIARELGLKPVPAALEADATKLRGSLLLHEVQLRSIDRATLVEEVAHELEEPLRRAGERGLDQEVIAEIDARPFVPANGLIDIKLGDLRSGVSQHLKRLAQSEPAAETARLRALIAQESTRLRQVEEALRLAAQQERTRELVAESQAELARLAERVAKNISQEYGRIVTELQAVADQLRAAVVDEVGTRHQIELLSGGRSAADLRSELVTALRQLGLADESGLDGLLATHDAKQRGLEEQLRATRGDLADAELIVASLEREIRPTLHELFSEPGLSWIRNAVPDVDGVADWSVDEQAALVGRIHGAGLKLREDLGRLRSTLDALEQALKATADSVGKPAGSDSVAGRRLGVEVRQVVAKRLEGEFDQPEIRDALFAGGSLEEIDLFRLEVAWRDREGSIHVRPFEAFSSGEQAFAYTRARIESVVNVAAPHKVVALDEFGAFLARDRLDRLIEFLRKSVIGKLAEQVILVLPLAMDYAAQAEITQGPLNSEYKRRAEEVASRGYFFLDASHDI